MGQILGNVTNFGDENEKAEKKELDLDEVAREPEVSMRQSMRVKGWGKSRHLDLVWIVWHQDLGELQSVCFLPNENVVVSDKDRSCLHMYDRDGQHVTDFHGTKFRPLQPTGITFDLEGCLLVLCNNDYIRGLRSYDIKPPYMIKKSKEKLFDKSTCLVVSNSGLLIVAEGGDQNCVNVLRGDGKRIRHFGSQYLQSPVGVAVDRMERVFVTDDKAHCVFVFSIEGALLWKFGSKGSGDNEFHSPQGICIDPCNNVYVADQYNDRIGVYSADGQLKFFFTTSKPIHEPRGLALDEFSGRIAVTSKYLNWRSVEVFLLKEHSPDS